MDLIKNLKKCNERKAFTLAEVLITLGIIGIIAAITLPTLIHNTNSKKFSSQFKKTLSTLSQAALTASAKYDTDFSGVSASAAASCAADRLSAGRLTMCGLLNETLSGSEYLGVYGETKAGKLVNPYSISTKAEGFTPANYLLYSLADGSIVGFNPNMSNCSVPRGQTLKSQMLTDSLSHCLGFIDVNGNHAPNKEVTCIDGKSHLVTIPCPLPKNGISADVFPIVFHNGKAEPATNAARSVLMGGVSREGFDPYTGSASNRYYAFSGD